MTQITDHNIWWVACTETQRAKLFVLVHKSSWRKRSVKCHKKKNNLRGRVAVDSCTVTTTMLTSSKERNNGNTPATHSVQQQYFPSTCAETSHVASLSKRGGGKKKGKKTEHKMLPRQKHNHFLWPWRTVGDKKRHNYLAQCWNHLFLKARSFIWKFSKAIESLYFSPCDVTGWLKHRQMCLKQVISPLSTPAPILRIDATCQDPVRPSGDTDKEEGDIDQV